MKNLILKFTSKSLRIVLFAWLFCSGILFAQDSSQYKSIWENYIWDFGEMESKPMGYSFCNMNWTAYSDKIVHYPDSDDTLLVQENKALCSTHPNDSNYILFYDVAHSNWKINNRQIAKSMLLQIVNSMDEFYTSDYYLGSDVSGGENQYEYGSVRYSFKNYACEDLCEIYISEKQFDSAYYYYQLMVGIYTKTHNCGTGAGRYKDRLDKLKGICLYGLGEYDSLISQNLHSLKELSRSRIYYSVIKAIKSKYSTQEINEYLRTAEQSIEIISSVDTCTYLISMGRYGEAGYHEEEKSELSSKARVKLFGCYMELDMRKPLSEPNFNKEDFWKDFQESCFYHDICKAEL